MCCWNEADMLSFLYLFLGNILPLLLRANHSIINETDLFSEMRSRGGHEAVEDEEQVFCLAFTAVGKDLDNVATEAIKAYTVLCRNSSLAHVALNLDS